MLWRISVVCLVVTGACTGVFADQVTFVNGDRLTGRIGHLVGGKLTFESDVAGPLTIDIADVATFGSDEAVELHLEDGSVVRERVSSSEPNYVTVRAAGRLAFAGISSINPPPKPKPKWTGEVSAGFTSTAGNTSTRLKGPEELISKSSASVARDILVLMNLDPVRRAAPG